MTLPISIAKPTICVRSCKVVTTYQAVAQCFQKRHRRIVRDN